MKINKLKVNGFGKLEQKEITFSDGINIVEGKNESGKSSLVKYMVAMLYGASKNKRGKEISDMEKFTPWGREEYSGTMEYTLDNGRKYELFRNFQKKTVTILNEQKEDISKQFPIDKTKGNQFFYEQTKIDENLFTSSFVSMQQEVKLKPEEQNTLLQKVTNLVNTGEDSVSYKKSVDKLNKRLTEDIGTTRTQNKPINIVENRIEQILAEKEELKEYQKREQEYILQKETLETQIEKNTLKYHFATEIQKIKDEQILAGQKITVYQEIEKTIEEKEQQATKQLKEMEQLLTEKTKKIEVQKKEKQKAKNKVYFISFMVLVFLTILSLVLIKNTIVNAIFVVLDVLYLIWILAQKSQKEKKENSNKTNSILEEIKIDIQNKEKEIELLEQNKKEKKTEIDDLKKAMTENEEKETQKVIAKYQNSLGKETIEEIQGIEKIQENIKEKIEQDKLNLHKIEVEQKNIYPKLEKIAELEEELENLEERKEELKQKQEQIELVIHILEEAYLEMKQNVVPKFTSHLSHTIDKISGGKYTNVAIKENNTLSIEAENGNYVPIDILSIGTIDQLYLSLRLSILQEITEERIPIILDEAFAYFDTERLQNILTYMAQELSNHQILIFTCTKREEEILTNIEVPFHKIELK